MEYRIEEGPALALAGIDLVAHTQGGSNLVEIPAFWDAIMRDGRFAALEARANFQGLGVCGVCRDFDMAAGTFIYSIAIDEPAAMEGLPAGTRRFGLPASTWGKFMSRGPLRSSFQATIRRIYAEWLPSSGWEHAGGPEIEYYPRAGGKPESADYFCEYWVPLRKAEGG